MPPRPEILDSQNLPPRRYPENAQKNTPKIIHKRAFRVFFRYLGGIFLGFQNFGPGGIFRYFSWKFRVGPSRGSVAGRGVLKERKRERERERDREHTMFWAIFCLFGRCCCLATLSNECPLHVFGLAKPASEGQEWGVGSVVVGSALGAPRMQKNPIIIQRSSDSRESPQTCDSQSSSAPEMLFAKERVQIRNPQAIRTNRAI